MFSSLKETPKDRLAVKSDGTIRFTDPLYGILSDYEGYRAESVLGDCYVFCFERGTGRLTIATDEVVEPSGLAHGVQRP